METKRVPVHIERDEDGNKPLRALIDQMDKLGDCVEPMECTHCGEKLDERAHRTVCDCLCHSLYQ